MILNTFKYDKYQLNGLLFALFLSVSQLNLKIFLPLCFLLIFFIFRKNFKVDIDNRNILIILFLKLFLICLVWLYFSNKSQFDFLRVVFVDISLILIFLIKSINIKFLKGLFYGILLLFLIDSSFNISALILGEDFFGRSLPGIRENEFMNRLPGIFGHPIASANITIIIFIFSIFFRNYFFLFISIFFILINGSYRPLLFLLLFIYSYFFISKKIRIATLFLSIFIFIFSMLIALNFHANGDRYDLGVNLNGSALRLEAFKSAIPKIAKSPLFGYHDVNRDPLDAVSWDQISDRGITESTYLQYAFDFGIPVMILYILFYFNLIKNFFNINKKTLDRNERFLFCLVYSLSMELFFGCFFSSSLTLFTVGFLLVFLYNYTKKS